MADIALSAVIKKALEIARNLVIEEGSRFYWLQEDISWIEREMRHIQAYLEDAEAKQSGSRGVTNLMNDIRDLAYDVEDIMDTFLRGTASHRRKGFLGFLKNFTCMFCDCYTAHEIAMEIEKIKRRVEAIDQKRKIFGITDKGVSDGRDTWDTRRSFPHVDEPNVVGFEEHTEKLEAKLLSTDVDYHAISIVGMPGVGKTTLAKKVYRSVQRHFECSAWVYVSQEPTIRDLLQDIARQVGLERQEWEENVESNLFEYLRGKRYVIVLDDIWQTKTYDALKAGIPNNSENCSRIILTSRNRDVGLYIGGNSSLHELLPLSPDDSWKLFSKMVMDPLQNTNEMAFSPELEDIGRQIVKKCGGVPLAIVVTAGLLLLRERTEHAWRGILESMGQDQDKCSKILALSYKDLPTNLKPCFLYFGIFPEDSEIFAFHLINLWVSEGFIQAKGERVLEDVGEDCLDNLVARNLIQVTRRRFDGRIKSCRIHDLLRSLCISVGEESNFFNTCEDVSFGSAMRVRRVSMHCTDISEYISLNYQTPKLRGVLCFNRCGTLTKKHLKNFLGDLRFLRVLRVECAALPSSLPNEIGNLSHLSYLRLKGDGLIKLPSSISNLKYLLTLDIRECLSPNFPTFIWKMKQLRHVLLSNFIQAPSLRLFGLNLDGFYQTEFSFPHLLTLYVVPSDCLNAEQLHKFTNLRKLGIAYPTKGIIKALSGAVPVSQKLENLRLMWFPRPTHVNLQFDMDPVSPTLNLSCCQNLCKLHLDGFMRKVPNIDKLPPNLTSLTLMHTELSEDPMETLKELPKLKILKLVNNSFNGTTMVCSGVDKFPQLEVLEITNLDGLKKLIVEEGGMPRLSKLKISHCYQLNIFPDRLREMMIMS